MKKLMNKIRKSNLGFTLVELIIVVAIIAVLSAVLAPQYIKYVEKSKIAKDMDTAAAIEQAVNVLCADGTIKASADPYVTWDVDTGLTSTVTANKTAVEALTGTIPKASSSKAVDVDFDVTFTSGTPTVTTTVDYSTWDD